MQDQSLNIIADANIWGANTAFLALHGFKIKLQVLEAQDITAESIHHADILLVRSSTAINEALLAGSNVRFVGTATIGDDHVDKLYLEQQGITFASAAGSSTESVVEYMLASFYHLVQQQRLNIQQDTLGIIGVGRIGLLLDQACQQAGLKTLHNDPPRAKEEGSQHFHSLHTLLEQADVLTLHTPLLTTGQFNTTHLLDETALQKFQGKGIINAGRGACLDNQALLTWLNNDNQRFAVLDCWESEPNINLPLLRHPQTLIATPHIAGHSLDGKSANTLFIYNALCSFLKVDSTWKPTPYLPLISNLECNSNIDKAKLSQLLYPIQNDDLAMKKAGLNGDTFNQWFRTYRRNYPIRRSWRKTLAAQSAYDENLFF